MGVFERTAELQIHQNKYEPPFIFLNMSKGFPPRGSHTSK